MGRSIAGLVYKGGPPRSAGNHVRESQGGTMSNQQAALERLKKQIGTTDGPSDWHAIDQKQINLFADATGDHQFIHIDPERAKATPFGGTIAHGFLTLSLLPFLQGKLRAGDPAVYQGLAMAVN